MPKNKSDLQRGQEDFIRGCFVRVCRIYFGVSLLEKITWHPDNICKLRVTGLRDEVHREFEHHLLREFDATGYTVLGCTASLDQEEPCLVFEVRSRLGARPQLAK